ncbi:DUF4225 domain-containing protein [Pseudomonas sp. ICMP 561]|uniref:DUF4225 domain-containing protein n=1 Tax=Pseudomonas sp. ICMP 561 TaxID=1718918 RepID=UPI000C0684C0|nr:DUF4225 domain-containing protein [Pseudomonas sp. ICMP 561]
MAEPKSNTSENKQLKQAAVALTNHACTLSMQHIQDGMLRLQFNREVAYYAQGIVRDVEGGRKSVAEGVKALEGEQESLKDQSVRIATQSIGLIAGGLQVTGGVGICVGSIGWMCAPAAIVIGHGLNNLYENGNNLLEGRSDTEGWGRVPYQAISEYFSGSKTAGNIAYGAVDVGLSVFGAYRLTVKKDAWRLFRHIDSDYVRAYKESSKTVLGIDAAAGTITTKSMLDEWQKTK